MINDHDLISELTGHDTIATTVVTTLADPWYHRFRKLEYNGTQDCPTKPPFPPTPPFCSTTLEILKLALDQKISILLQIERNTVKLACVLGSCAQNSPTDEDQEDNLL